MNAALAGLGSKKLVGLVIAVAALLALFAVYLLASIWIDVSETVVTAISTSLTALGGAHQAAQAAADRSPNYPRGQE